MLFLAGVPLPSTASSAMLERPCPSKLGFEIMATDDETLMRNLMAVPIVSQIWSKVSAVPEQSTLQVRESASYAQAKVIHGCTVKLAKPYHN